jgi:hypothetical protein
LREYEEEMKVIRASIQQMQAIAAREGLRQPDQTGT